MGNILRLPNKGQLIVCTDLQGCLRDYHSVESLFLKLQDETSDAYLLFTGDLIHGPYIDEADWPHYLGEFYRDQSVEVVAAFFELKQKYPDRVHALLGNHEHGHVGGPHTAKFARDEVALLEQLIGPKKTEFLKGVLRTLPVMAIAPCGAVFTHGAPAAQISSAKEIEHLKPFAPVDSGVVDFIKDPVLGTILWARSAEEKVADRFLNALGAKISIYGHDVVPSGYEMFGSNQIIVSTSFGVFDSNKVYLQLDLSSNYQTVRQFRAGREIRPLYPDKAPPALGGHASVP